MAATPAWFADNVGPIAILMLLVLAVLVLRLVQQTALRLFLLALIAGVALLAYANRDPLQACARTCECQIAGRDVTIPACHPDASR